MINALLTALFPTRGSDDPGQPRGYTGRHRHPALRAALGTPPNAVAWDSASTVHLDDATTTPPALA